MATLIHNLPMTVSEEQAQSLCEEFSRLVVLTDSLAHEILETRAWHVRFDAFEQAWQEWFRGVGIRDDRMRARMAIAMMESGLSDEDIVRKTYLESEGGRGVTEMTVAAVRRMWEDGVEFDLMFNGTVLDRDYGKAEPEEKVAVKSYQRAKPGSNLTLSFDAGEVAEFKRIAALLNADVCDLAQQAVRDRFKILQKHAER